MVLLQWVEGRDLKREEINGSVSSGALAKNQLGKDKGGRFELGIEDTKGVCCGLMRGLERLLLRKGSRFFGSWIKHRTGKEGGKYERGLGHSLKDIPVTVSNLRSLLERVERVRRGEKASVITGAQSQYREIRG